MRRLISCILISVFTAALFAGCGKEEETLPGIYEYLGDYSYDSTVTAFVYESVAGEDEYGIQYREVKDIEGLLASDNTVMLYFYSSMASDIYGITAGAEDIAQCTWGEMTVIMIDVLDNNALSSRYEIDKVPEFVIVRSGNEISRFEGYNYSEWTMSDVAAWVTMSGVRVDYSRINQ